MRKSWKRALIDGLYIGIPFYLFIGAVVIKEFSVKPVHVTERIEAETFGYNPAYEDETESYDLVTLRTTAYCSCEKCCGHNTGITYSGTMAKAEHTIGANLEEFQIGTEIEIDGITYVVEDKGNLSKGTIDIFFNSHEEALNYGVQYKVATIK